VEWDLSEQLVALEEAVAVAIILSRLNFSRRERLLLDRIMGDEPVSLSAVGRRLGVSKQAVSRADQNLKQRLRHEFQAMGVAA
jgi:DNA-directed RNA polymerase specialized sigma subunit